MASHRNTPRSILHAPKAEVIPLVETKGLNRKERRHGAQRVTMTPDGEKVISTFGAKARGFFKRTPVIAHVKGIGSAKQYRKLPDTPFREAYPTDNVPYVKPKTP